MEESNMFDSPSRKNSGRVSKLNSKGGKFIQEKQKQHAHFQHQPKDSGDLDVDDLFRNEKKRFAIRDIKEIEKFASHNEKIKIGKRIK